MEEKLSHILQLSSLKTPDPKYEEKTNGFIKMIHEAGINDEFEEFKKIPGRIFPVRDDDLFCPRCGGELTETAENRLKQGRPWYCVPHIKTHGFIQFQNYPNRSLKTFRNPIKGPLQIP